MKNAKWLDITEYVLWAGSGVGSVASIASQQLAFTAAPLSFLLLLNLVNRRRLDQQVQKSAQVSLEQLDQRLSQTIHSLDQQVQALPSFSDLKSLKKTVLQHNDLAIAQVQQTLSQRLAPIEAHDLNQMQQDLAHLRSKSVQLGESVASVTNHLNRVANVHRVESVEATIGQLQSEITHLKTTLNELPKTSGQTIPRALQDQINHLNRRLNALPQPFDATVLRQDVDGLIKVMSDLVSRREMARLMAEVEKIRQQNQTLEQTVIPLRAMNLITRKQMDTLSSWLSLKNEQGESLPNAAISEAVLNKTTTIATLEKRLNGLPTGEDLTKLHAEMQTMVNRHLGKLQQQVSTVQQFTQSLDRQQKDLGDWLNRLPQILDTSALQSQIKYLTTRLEWTETTLASLQTQVEAVVDQPAPQLGAEYQLVFNLKAAHDYDRVNTQSSRALDDALKTARSRLIVVFPYPDPATFNDTLMGQFKAFLDRGGRLDIGWGHLGNLHDSHSPHYIHDRATAKSVEKSCLHTILSQLTQLKRQYPNQFRFKVLGTDENFLVCLSDETADATRAYGILGVHSVATTSAAFPEVAVGLRTTNPDVIKGLTDRFDHPVLGAHDAVSHYNRAVTRYELGDKSGAISDYSEVVRIDPTHAIAYNNRALVREELGNKEGAISDLNRALLLNPHRCVTYCNRGVIRLELGDKVGAIEDFTYAIQLEGDCAIAYLQRGLARLKLGNKMGAVEDFTALIHRDGQDAIAYFHRGTVRAILSDKAGAIQDFKKAAGLFSTQGSQDKYQRSIEAMNKLRKRLVLAAGSAESN